MNQTNQNHPESPMNPERSRNPEGSLNAGKTMNPDQSTKTGSSLNAGSPMNSGGLRPGRQINRRTALKLTLTAALMPWAISCKSDSPDISQLNIIRVKNKSGEGSALTYLEITTSNGISGYSGPLFPAQAMAMKNLLPGLRKLLTGQDPLPRSMDFEWIWKHLYPDNQLSGFQNGIDPLTGESIWNRRRSERHTSTGAIITALSSVDNALWDVRGKLSGKPVYRLLGGTREKLRAYMSLQPDDKLSETRKRARELYDQGQTAQKWFFRWGPPDGKEGFSKITGLVEGLRTELGDDASLMFDFAVGQRGRCDWDVDYAIRVAKAIQPFHPTWLEEPFSPEEIESYRRLRGETNITLATGEHTYTRWNIKPFLDEKLISFAQCDPEWCGGISELLKICDLVNEYANVKLIPHGHHILAASQVVASQPESLCPMVEYGPNWVIRHQRAQTRTIKPEAGIISTPHEPGIGPSPDWEQVEKISS